MPHRAPPVALFEQSVRLRDLAAQDAILRDEIRAAVDEVLASGRYIGGPRVDALETKLAASLGVPHVVTVNSGTDALVLILRAAGIGLGDEVIVPSYTFVASASAVSLAGATPVFADSLGDSPNVDPASVAAALTPRTRAIVAVHLFGEPAEVDALTVLCERNGLLLIEDAAQAFGARDRGRSAGSIGAAAAFSFYPTKNLACAGDGGAVATRDAALAATIRSLANHGAGTEALRYERVGTNSRLDAVQAAILEVKLPYVERWNAQRRNIADAYARGLAGTRAISPAPPPHVEHVYNQYVIRHPERDALREHLARRGVPTAIYYETPCHLQPVYARGAPRLERAEAWSRTSLALPVYPELAPAAVDVVCAAVRAFDS